MPFGTVKFFNKSKGFGFIINEAGGADVFVHVTAVEDSGKHSLEENQRVSFDLEEDKHGKSSARNIKAL